MEYGDERRSCVRFPFARFMPRFVLYEKKEMKEERNARPSILYSYSHKHAHLPTQIPIRLAASMKSDRFVVYGDFSAQIICLIR